MKIERMGITEILSRIWLFSANKIKALNLLIDNQLNSSLWQIIDSRVICTDNVLIDALTLIQLRVRIMSTI